MTSEPKNASDHGDGEPSKQRRILVADDNEDAAASLSALLRILGNEVRTACDGQEALEIAATFRPDVALLDIGMPRMNGYDTAQRMRRESWGSGILLIALTGWGQEDHRRRSQDAGFDHHLVKPIQLGTLTEIFQRDLLPEGPRASDVVG